MWRIRICGGTGAQRLGREHEFAVLQAERLAPDDARHVEPFDGADGEEDEREMAPEEGHQQDDEEHEGQRIEPVDQPHHRHVDAPAREARDGAVARADEQRDRAAERADDERYSARDHHTRQQVAAVRIGARDQPECPQRRDDDEPPSVLAALDDSRRAEGVGAFEIGEAALADRPGRAQGHADIAGFEVSLDDVGAQPRGDRVERMARFALGGMGLQGRRRADVVGTDLVIARGGQKRPGETEQGDRDQDARRRHRRATTREACERAAPGRGGGLGEAGVSQAAPSGRSGHRRGRRRD